MKFDINNFTRKKIPLLICIMVIAIAILSLSFGNKVVEILSSNNNYKSSLSEERQAAYDKMKIDYVNIKNRVTGTAPWNSGDVSDADGIDVSDTDDYVRTFDVMKYTIELGISPNTNLEGVTDASTFTGGVIKVRAKLPNQSDLILMTWEEDAWMQNISYNTDKTEIYAEYHVPSSTSVTNANQNLTFTIKIGGYKKEITDEMKPEFEVWMEGNQPDNSSSSISSVSAKDNKNIIISGKYSLDAQLASGNNLKNSKDDVVGNYMLLATLVSLRQYDSNVSDLRGTLYPGNEITLKVKLTYKYIDTVNGTEWITLDDMNNTELIAYSLNDGNDSNYFPAKQVAYNLPAGGYKLGYGSQSKKSVVDSGDYTVTYDGEYLYLTYKNYQFTGDFPDKFIWSATNTSPYPPTTGYFISTLAQLFVPHYGLENQISYDYNIDYNLVDFTYKDQDGNSITVAKDTNDNVADYITSNNSVSFNMQTRLTGSYYIYGWVNGDQQYSSRGAQYGTTGNTISYTTRLDVTGGPYNGGTDRLITWNNDYLTLTSNNGWYSVTSVSPAGFATPTGESVYFGVYKIDSENGVTDDAIVQSATYDDFIWYETAAEALENGKISAVFMKDPNHVTYMYRYLNLYFLINNNPDHVGDVAIIRHKARVYNDDDTYYIFGESNYTSTSKYIRTKYNSDGTITYHSAHEYGQSVYILSNLVSINTTVTDKDSNGDLKKAYDVQDGEINFSLLPSLTNKQTATDSDEYVNGVIITSVLPKGLSYKTGSANKEPESVAVNSDGTTTITWQYDNWQVNHAAPDYSNITFTAEISASLENNQSLNVTSEISYDQDLRENKYKISSYGVVISNLAGSKAIKEINKTILEKNESFIITSSIGNTSQENLINVKSLEILPTNGDSNGSIFSGDYTIKVVSLAENQKIFYATDNVSNIGITEDKYGKLTIKDVDIENDDRWIEVGVGDIIPENATAISTLNDTIQAATTIDYQLEIIPADNKEKDTYAFTMNVTSDNLNAAVKTNTVVAKVIERNISGIAFIDNNRNNIYDNKDTLLSDNIVKLLDSTGNIVASTQTDSNGKYLFENVDKGNYYVEFSIPNNYEVISKNSGEDSNSNIANSNGKTDLLTGQNQTSTQEVENLENINLGIRKISSSLIVKYLEAGTNNVLAPQEESTVYYGDTYTTKSSTEIPSNYELLKKTDNYTGIVSSKTIEVIYYYQKKDSSLETSISKDGPESITAKDEVVKYEIKYNAKVVDYIGTGTITIVDTLPYAIDEEESSLDGGTYNADDKTITWTEEWKDIDTYNSKDSKEITKNIELVYLGIEGTDRIMVNSIAGNIKLDNNERDIESQTSTDIKISGKIITHHYIKGTTDKLEDDIESTDLVGESFTSSALDIPGYIITKPETEEYVFTEEDQEVIYEYEKIKLKITTIVNGIGGTISGSEEVLYGDNSTKDYIVIKPDEGYVLGSVMINGVEIELSEEEKKQLILNNFENMTENLSIQVTFIKAPVVNPETSSFITFIVGLFIISFIICFYLYKNKKVNRFNKMI